LSQRIENIGRMPTKEEEDIQELIRLRTLEEQKIIESTRKSRKLRQRELIGNEAEEVGERKHHIDDAKKLWSNKGATDEDKKAQLESYGATTIGASALSKAKQQYEENLKSIRDKGKSEDHIEVDDKEVPDLDNLKSKYNKPKSKMPSFFAKMKNKKKTSQETVEKDKTAGAPTGFADEFETIEKREEKMVGEEKHITITGISKAGRRTTRTKIILPKVVGKTQSQSQHAEGAAAKGNHEANNPLLPDNFSGTYYSLDAIKQQNIPSYKNVIDKNSREQYLSPEEFEKVFGMTKDDFAKLPKWKRVNLKRDCRLY